MVISHPNFVVVRYARDGREVAECAYSENLLVFHDVLDEFARTKYVLDSCERGVIIGHTSKDLVDHLKHLVDDLNDVIENIYYNRCDYIRSKH